MILPLFYKWGKGGTGRTSNFLCVTWLVNGGAGNWVLAHSFRGCARNTSLYFLLKVIEAVPVHKDVRSISVEVAQSLSITKDKLYLCEEETVDVRGLRTQVNQGGLVTRPPGNGLVLTKGGRTQLHFGSLNWWMCSRCIEGIHLPLCRLQSPFALLFY